MSKISDEQIDVMLAGLEGVTPGPWDNRMGIVRSIDGDEAIPLFETRAPWKKHRRTATVAKQEWHNGHHIARCDPGAIYSILTELRALRSGGQGKGTDEEDLASDDRWNAGVNYAIERLCEIFGIHPKTINWDAATETMDGDVMSVICNVLVAAYGEEWSSSERETTLIRSALTNTDLSLRAENERLRHDNSDLLAAADADAYVARQLLVRATTAEEKLEEAAKVLGRVADIAERNFGRQNEKMADIAPIARSFLANLKGAE